MHDPERAGDGLEGLPDRGVLRRVRLKLGQGRLQMRQGCLCALSHRRSRLALNLMQRSHRLRDRRCQVE
jgi:hypothetical protein